MRGKGIPYSTAQKWSRITPAYAGKSRSQHLPPSLSWDHPRLCGEKTVARMSEAWNRGSPPPMRGKVSILSKIIDFYRITPAYAGKRVIRSGFHKLFQDHPRLCGEKLCFACCRGLAAGSPPPMRGKVLAEFGKTSKAWDHPRLCGEKVKFTKK